MKTIESKKNFKILVVDDDDALRGLIANWVTSMGHHCETVEDGQKAVDYLSNTSCDLVLTDMIMPNMDGMQLLKHIKEKHTDISVIVLTGYSNEYSYVDVVQAGAADFITKPFMRDEFSAKLDRVLKERRLLEELRESKNKAEASSKAKTAFLNVISHELKTPMNGIIGFTQLLSEAELPPDKKKYVKMVSISADRLMKFISQILDFSTIESGKNDMKICHFHLGNVFEEIFITAKPKSEKKGIVLNLEIAEVLSGKLLFGDQLVLVQILYNLIDNAIKFTDYGSIEIKVKKVKELCKDTIELQFSIKDSGCGIDPEKQGAIFDPFTQAEEYMTRKHEGAGLGLAICAKLVSMVSGKIWLESSLGEGSTFYFTAKMKVA